MHYQSKVVRIEAFQFQDERTFNEMANEWGQKFLIDVLYFAPTNLIVINTLEGKMTAKPGDWIVKGTEGEFYPVKDSVFKRKYEAVEFERSGAV